MAEARLPRPSEGERGGQGQRVERGAPVRRCYGGAPRALPGAHSPGLLFFVPAGSINKSEFIAW